MAPECGCISDEYMKHSLLSCCIGNQMLTKDSIHISHTVPASTNDISETRVMKLIFFQKAVLMQYQRVAETY